jgi:hypothetical protein
MDYHNDSISVIYHHYNDFMGRQSFIHIGKEVLKCATRIAKRYVGKKDSKAYGERNSGEGAVLMQLKPTKIIAEKDIAAWE